MKFNPDTYRPSGPEQIRLFQEIMNRKRLVAYRVKLHGTDIQDNRSLKDDLYMVGLVLLLLVIVISAILGVV